MYLFYNILYSITYNIYNFYFVLFELHNIYISRQIIIASSLKGFFVRSFNVPAEQNFDMIIHSLLQSLSILSTSHIITMTVRR